MRQVRLSKTARDHFQVLLRQGAEKFGVELAEAKRKLVDDCIAAYLIENPHHGLRDPSRSLRYFPVSKTPFTIVYEFDDYELRVLFIIHSRADRRQLDPAAVEW
jgi:plasmid stabilization system protein ParE